jgi:mRNA degradation ribonuclease J1/J2
LSISIEYQGEAIGWMMSSKLRIIPLGGLGEIGKNMMVLEYDDSIIAIDAGLMFPEQDMLGVDIVVPVISWRTWTGCAGS